MGSYVSLNKQEDTPVLVRLKEQKKTFGNG